MKVWKLFVALLLMAPTLNAQSPFCGYPYVQPYFPYYPGAYYSLPYCPQVSVTQPYYPQWPNVSLQFSTANDYYGTVNDLTRQIQQLTDQIRQLQVQIASTQAQPPHTRIVEVTSRPRESTPMIFVFKDGSRIESQGYAVANQMLWILTQSGFWRIGLSNLDVVATQKENLKRGINFDLPTS